MWPGDLYGEYVSDTVRHFVQVKKVVKNSEGNVVASLIMVVAHCKSKCSRQQSGLNRATARYTRRRIVSDVKDIASVFTGS